MAAVRVAAAHVATVRVAAVRATTVEVGHRAALLALVHRVAAARPPAPAVYAVGAAVVPAPAVAMPAAAAAVDEASTRGTSAAGMVVEMTVGERQAVRLRARLRLGEAAQDSPTAKKSTRKEKRFVRYSSACGTKYGLRAMDGHVLGFWQHVKMDHLSMCGSALCRSALPLHAIASDLSRR